MNERIRELAEQALKASMEHDGVYRPEGCANSVSKAFADNFAKLIVRECAEVVNELADPDCSESYVWAIQNATEQIKLHFGLKE